MVRLAKYKLFHKKMVKNFGKYQFDQFITKTSEFIKENEGTLDAIVGKTTLAGWYLAEGKFNEIKTILDALTLTGDNLVDSHILDIKSSYFFGFNDPPIDLEKAKDYYQKYLEVVSKIKFQDDWERVVVTVYILMGKMNRENDSKEILKLIDQCLGISAIYPGNKLKFQQTLYNNIGNMYMKVGKLDLAIKYHKSSIENSLEIDYSFMPISNLAYDYLLKNDLKKAKATLELAFNKFDKSSNYWLKSMVLLREAEIFEQQQKFDELEKNVIRHLELATKTNNSLKIFERKLDLMVFFYKRYMKTKDKQNLDKVIDIKDQLQTLAQDTDYITITRLNNYAKALVFKIGSIKQKAHAIEIYEELVKVYPNDPKYKLDLIELHWEDLENDLEGEVKKEIDRILADIQKLPFMNSQSLDVLNVSYKILIAKYDFYINGNTKDALESLYMLQSHSISYGFKMIEERLNKEIAILDKDIGWDTNYLSLKERFDKIKFKSYIEGARSLIDGDFKY